MELYSLTYFLELCQKCFGLQICRCMRYSNTNSAITLKVQWHGVQIVNSCPSLIFGQNILYVFDLSFTKRSTVPKDYSPADFSVCTTPRRLELTSLFDFSFWIYLENSAFSRLNVGMSAASILSRIGHQHHGNHIPSSCSSGQSLSISSLLLPSHMTSSPSTSSIPSSLPTVSSPTGGLLGFSNSNFNNLSLQGSLWTPSNAGVGGGTNPSRNTLRSSSPTHSLPDSSISSALDVMMESARKVADLSSPSSILLSNDSKSTTAGGTSSWNAFSLIPFLQGVSAAAASGSTSSPSSLSSLHPSSDSSSLTAWSAAMAAYASFLPHVSPAASTSTTANSTSRQDKDSSRGERHGECNQGHKLNFSSFDAQESSLGQ